MMIQVKAFYSYSTDSGHIATRDATAAANKWLCEQQKDEGFKVISTTANTGTFTYDGFVGTWYTLTLTVDMQVEEETKGPYDNDDFDYSHYYDDSERELRAGPGGNLVSNQDY